jgi:glycosyltransferase involved in cell wall biosynthesis
LIYEKGGLDRATVEKLVRRWPASVRLRYGRFRRERLLDAARRARACVYLSNHDRGPLALAEMLLCGCPAVGIARGAPWIVDGVTGFTVRSLEYDALSDALQRAMTLERQAVRAAALERFDAGKIVQTIIRALDAARWDG